MPGPIQLVNLFALAAPGVNTDFAPTDTSLPLTVPPNVCTLKVHVALATASIFRVMRRPSASGTQQTTKANGGVALAAACGYDFETAVVPGEVVNFEVETDGIVIRLIVVGIDGEQS